LPEGKQAAKQEAKQKAKQDKRVSKRPWNQHATTASRKISKEQDSQLQKNNSFQLLSLLEAAMFSVP